MKKGFTLVELLAIIALLGIIALIAIPNVLDSYKNGKNKLSDIQKNEIENAVKLYINDYCLNPISESYSCPTNWVTSYENGIINVKNATISLSELKTKEYFDSTISNNCSGNIVISNTIMNLDGITCNFNK